MRIIPDTQREVMERNYLVWFMNEITKLSNGRTLEELQSCERISVALEFMDFAVLSFRETGRIDDLKQVTRYTLEVVKTEAMNYTKCTLPT